MVSRKFEISLERLVEAASLPPKVSEGIRRAGGPARLTKKLTPPGRIAAAARYHMALSDEVRLRILHALTLSDMCPCVLKEITGTSDSKLSYHLKILESEGLIGSNRVKSWRIYSISAKGRRALRL